MDEYLQIGIRIKELRLSQNKTLEQVAKAVGVNASTVCRWESGNIANIRRKKFKALADALGASPDYLISGDATKKDRTEHIVERLQSDPKKRELLLLIKDASAEEVQKIIEIIKVMRA